jgi:hypothetical protein
MDVVRCCVQVVSLVGRYSVLPVNAADVAPSNRLHEKRIHRWRDVYRRRRANANFYFAATLVICTAQVFMLTDILFAFLRREHDLVSGVKPLTSDGKPAMIILD